MKARPTRLKVMTIPGGFKDAAELFQAAGDSAIPVWQAAVDNAQPWVAWMIDTVDTVGGFDTRSPEGQQDAVEDVCDAIAHLPAIERSARVQQLAAKLGLDELTVRRALREIYMDRYGTRLADANPLGYTLYEIAE